MKIGVLGFDRQGRSALEYWGSSDNDLTVCDINPDIKIPSGVSTQLGRNYLQNLDRFDLIIRTPGLHPRDIVAASSQDILNKTTTVTNEFFKVCPSKNIIGVTGTKGKGTTSTLITKMLQAAGKTVHLGGNIGIAPLDMLKNGIKPEDWVVLELANFQLIDIKHSPKFGVCLMVSPEHMDWHNDIDEYISAKQQMFRYQKASNKAIYFADNDNSKKVVKVSPGQKIPYYKPPGAVIKDNVVMIADHKLCDTSEIKLLGKHNWQNICAAVTAVWQISQNLVAIREVITTFEGLPHRLELVRKLKGVTYYNDSFASNPSATTAALDSVLGKKIVVLGGYDRGISLSDLSKKIVKNKERIRKVILIGASASRVEESLKEFGYSNVDNLGSTTIEKITKHVQKISKPGDSVLFSPGFPSFDMFRDFEDRGNKFRSTVENL